MLKRKYKIITGIIFNPGMNAKKCLFVLLALFLAAESMYAQNITVNTHYYSISDGVNSFFDAGANNFRIYKNIQLENSYNMNVGNILMDNQSFIHNYGQSNLFMGILSGNYSMNGISNTCFGNNTLNKNTNGFWNCALGLNVLYSNTSGSKNSAIGYISMANNNTGTENVSIGMSSLERNVTGSWNVSPGSNSMLLNTSGNKNTSIGYFSLGQNNNDFNLSIGSESMRNTTEGWCNTTCGSQSSISIVGDYSCILGSYSMQNASDCDSSSSLGYKTLFWNNKTCNSAFGFVSQQLVSSGFHNSSFGNSTLQNNISGRYNCGFGTNSLLTMDSGNFNSSFGFSSLYDGPNINNCTIFGAHNRPYHNYYSTNSISIGAAISALYNFNANYLSLGNNSCLYAGIQVPWTSTSDKRLKENIADLDLGLNFIKKLNPVSYNRKSDVSKRTEFGLIAQELKKILDDENIENPGIISISDSGYYSVRYNDLYAIIIRSLQELSVKNEKLNEKYLSLKTKNDENIAELSLLNDELVKVLNSLDITDSQKSILTKHQDD